MRGEWTGLQALFVKECPSTYYVHCQAHQLQLALIAATREVSEVHEFFKDLIFIVSCVSSSSKRHDELQDNQVAELEHLVEIEGIETGTGLNQIGTLQRPGDTRWSSHYQSIRSLLLIKVFNATRTVLETIATDRYLSFSQRGDAKYALKKLLTFDFIFILHMLEESMSYTDTLCRSLQYKSQDILNAMDSLNAAKSLIQDFRKDGWEKLLKKVVSFCGSQGTLIPNMNDTYSDIIRSSKDDVRLEHHYRVDVFMAVMDQLLQELNSHFSEQTTELLILSSTLNPKDGYNHFNIEKIYLLADKYYSEDFSGDDKDNLKVELNLFRRDVPNHPELKNASTLSDLCQNLAGSGKTFFYPLIDRLVRLVLTLTVSTATTERAFSAMKIVKTSLRNKMEDDFLSDYLTVYIEKEIAEKFSINSIIDDFDAFKPRRVRFH